MDYYVKTTVNIKLSSLEMETLRDELGEIHNILAKQNIELKEVTSKLVDILDNYYENNVIEE